MENVGIKVGNDIESVEKAQQTLEEVAYSNRVLAQAMLALANSNQSIAEATAKVFAPPSNISISGCSITMGQQPESIFTPTEDFDECSELDENVFTNEVAKETYEDEEESSDDFE